MKISQWTLYITIIKLTSLDKKKKKILKSETNKYNLNK